MALYRFGGILQNLQVLLVLVGKYRIFLNKPKTFNINIDICFTCSVIENPRVADKVLWPCAVRKFCP